MPSPGSIRVDQFVAEFGEHVDAQTAGLFVGAGLSIGAGYPSWEDLVAPYQESLRIDLTDLPLLVQYYQDSRPERAAQVRADIIAMVRGTSASPTAAHRRVLGLPIPDIWTTNYDDLLERTADELGLRTTVYAEDRDLATLVAATKRLYKMHGTVGPTNTSERLMIARDDFEKYPRTHPRFWQLLRAQFLTRTFLFVGFSLADPNITEIFRLARLYTPDVQRPHYALLTRPPEAQRRVSELRLPDLARVGVKVVELGAHSELDAVLGRLSARSRPPRAYLSGSLPSDHPDPDRTRAIAMELALQVSSDQEIRLMTGGELGAIVGYEVLRIRQGNRTTVRTISL
jgi:hypothetical protein